MSAVAGRELVSGGGAAERALAFTHQPLEGVMRQVIVGVTCGIALFVCVGCGSGEEEGEGASGATCPTDSTLTYETFARPFTEQYCTRCHSSALTDDARNGAPSEYNLDTLAAIRAVGAEEIDEQAAAGPSNVNMVMPPSDPRPTEAERRLLGEWLACGMP
jgi:uncharacterized membrane protein